MDRLLHDFRLALRQLRRTPAFTLTTLLSLALGIGATTAMFSVINSVLLRPLPFPEQDRIVWANMEPVDAPGRRQVLSYPDFFDWRAQAKSFSAIASFVTDTRTLTGYGDPRHVPAAVVSSDFFNVFGVKPLLGRGFTPDEEKPGVHVAVLSHQFWREMFNESPDIVGKTITMSGNIYQVVGVMPTGFVFPIEDPSPAVWVTLADDAVGTTGAVMPLTQGRGAHLLDVVGRLKPGVSIEQARSELSLITSNLAQQYPGSDKQNNSAIVTTALKEIVGDTEESLRLLFGSVCFLLLITCLNIAGLMLARGSRRTNEIAVRAALGAGRFEIVRLVLVESLTTAVVGGVLGVVLAAALIRASITLLPTSIPRLQEITLDGRVLAFAVLLSAFCGVFFGILPALRMSNLQPASLLRAGGRTSTADRRQNRIQTVLVIAETALGLVLLTGSGLMVRSLVHLMNVDPGFDTKNVVSMRVELSYPKSEQQVQFYNQLLPRIAALPGVQSATAALPIPLQGGGFTLSFAVEGRTYAPGEGPSAAVSLITPNFFETLKIPVIKGRTISGGDTAGSQRVVVINQSFANKYFPNEDPIGKSITPGVMQPGENKPAQVIGVVGDAKRDSLAQPISPQYYLAYSQLTIFSPSLCIRTAGDPTALVGAVREQVAQLDKNVPVFSVRTMGDFMSSSASTPRFQAILISTFASMSLLLAAIGLYALLSYMVTQRTLEIGLRMALGAQRGAVLRLILRRGFVLTGAGLLIGLAISLGATQLMKKMLFGVQPIDLPTLAGVTFVLLLVCLMASAAPAMRAARLDPMRTLREQ